MENSFVVTVADRKFDVKTTFLPDENLFTRMEFEVREDNGNEYNFIANYQVHDCKLAKFDTSETPLEIIYRYQIIEQILKVLGEIAS